MELVIKDKGEFITKFLKPVCNISDSGCLKIQENKITSINSTQDSSVILFAQCDINIDIDKPIILNCPDLRRLERIFSLLDTNEVKLKYNGNSLSYNDGKIRFTYHLLESGILRGPSLSADKIGKLTFNLKFIIEQSKITELIKGSSFANTASKLYISFIDGKIYGEIADKTNPLLDTFTTILNDNFIIDNQINDIPINFETVKVLSTVKWDKITVNVNTSLGIVLFEINEERYKLKYIVSALLT